MINAPAARDPKGTGDARFSFAASLDELGELIHAKRI